MSHINTVRKLLETQLNTITSMSGMPTDVAWENVNFVPTEQTSWLRANMTVTSQQMASIGYDKPIRHDGLFLVDIFVKQGVGANTADTIAEQIRDIFYSGLKLVEDSVDVRIAYCQRSGGIDEESWYMLPITISWYSFEMS